MVRKLIAGIAGVLTGLVAACEEAPQSTVVYMRPGGAEPFLAWAVRSGPLLVQTFGSPFDGGRDIAEDVAQAAARGIHGRKAEATSDPARAPAPDYRVHVGFDLPKGFAPERLCTAVAAGDLPREPDPERLRVIAVFCVQGRMEAAVIGSLKRPVAPGDDRLGALITQMSRQMFAAPRGT